MVSRFLAWLLTVLSGCLRAIADGLGAAARRVRSARFVDGSTSAERPHLDLLPPDDRWRHRHGSPGHGRSHVMPALVPPYASVPVAGGRLALGTWQSICLVDLNVDNARRQVRMDFLSG